MNAVTRHALAFGFAVAIAIGVLFFNPGASQAAPMSAGVAALSEAAPSDVIDVRHRRHWRRAAVAGIALGIAGIAAHHAWRHHHYYPYHYGYYPYHYHRAPHCIRYRGRTYCR